MHKLGSKGAKLRDLQEIRQSFIDLSADIEMVQHLDLCNIPDADIEHVGKQLRTLIEKLKVGANSTILVPGTKAIHHLLPSLCPPIDRNYTLRFFYDQRQTTRSEGNIFAGDISGISPSSPFLQENDFTPDELIVTDGSSPTKIIHNAIVGG